MRITDQRIIKNRRLANEILPIILEYTELGEVLREHAQRPDIYLPPDKPTQVQIDSSCYNSQGDTGILDPKITSAVEQLNALGLTASAHVEKQRGSGAGWSGMNYVMLDVGAEDFSNKIRGAAAEAIKSARLQIINRINDVFDLDIRNLLAHAAPGDGEIIAGALRERIDNTLKANLQNPHTEAEKKRRKGGHSAGRGG